MSGGGTLEGVQRLLNDIKVLSRVIESAGIVNLPAASQLRRIGVVLLIPQVFLLLLPTITVIVTEDVYRPERTVSGVSKD